MIIPADGGNTTRNTSAFFGLPVQIRTDNDTSYPWLKFRIYDVGGALFGLRLKNVMFSPNESFPYGHVHIIRLSENGYTHQSPQDWEILYDPKWSFGWTHIEFFKLGNKTYMLAYMEKWSWNKRNVDVHIMKDNGDYDPNPVFSALWSENWSKLRFFKENGKTWLLRLKTTGTGSNGSNVNINKVNNNGTIETIPTYSRNLSEGWTTVRFYYVNGKTYLFLLRKEGFEQDGTNVNIYAMNNDGSIGLIAYKYTWRQNWDYAQFFKTEDILYLMLYRKDSGDVHVHHIKDNGELGTRVVTCRDPYFLPNDIKFNENGNGSMWHLGGPKSWNKDWQFLEFFTPGKKNTYLFKMKENGNYEIVPIKPMKDIGPMVTYADENQALVWVGLVGPDPMNRVIKYSINYKKISDPSSNMAFALPGLIPVQNQEYFSSCVFELDVEPATRYEYYLFYDNSNVATGHFTTPSIQNHQTKFKAVFASCMDLSYGRIQQAWNHVLGLEPELLILGGDNVYANSTDRSMLWAEHIQQRSVESFAKVIKEMPVLAVYDDHDFGPDNSRGGDRDIAYRVESKNTFKELFPNPHYPVGDQNGINFYYYWGNVRFIFLDERYFRTKPGAGSKLLGESQWQWLENIFQNRKAKINVIVSSTTISKGESWKRDGDNENYASDWSRLERLLVSFPNTIIVSGDVHFCDIIDHSLTDSEDTITEIISSGIAQYTNTNDAGPTGFACIEFNTIEEPAEVNITLYYKDGSIRDTKRLSFL